MEIKCVAIVGRGAIGTLLGTLWTPNCDLAFIVDEKRKQKYEADPLLCNGKTVSFRYVSDVSQFYPVDMVCIATKFTGLPKAIAQIKPFLHKDTILVSALNGISSETILRKEFPDHCVVRTIVQGMDSTYLHNEVNFQTVGELLFGQELDTESNAVCSLEAFYQRTRTPYRKCKDIVYQ